MKRQTGFGMIAAIMILVILATLAAALARMGATQQLNSAHDTLSARAWQAAKAGNEWGLYQALHRFFTVAGGGGAASALTITTTNDFLAAGVAAGMAVSGTGVGAGAIVQSVDSPTQITVNVPNAAGGVSGVLTFGTSPAGIWGTVACAAQQTQTLDLHVETGFWVTVSCQENSYTEGSYTIYVYRIDSVACNSSVGCPDNAMAKSPNYVEREREVIATSY